MDDDLDRYRRELRLRCSPLHGHGWPEPAADFAALAEWCRENDVAPDNYGEGDAIESFEARIADMFGHEAARFMPSGTMAQAIAMRIWCGKDGHFGMHPTCHLELHEQRGYRHLLDLDATLIGSAHRPIVAEDLASITERLDALIVELPTRENGGQLPTWDELEELSELARERGTAVHLDGARVWEAQAGYGRSLAEIGALFDSVYVSFYKGINALPGAMLIGDAEFVDEAKIWQRRMGGNLFNMVSNVVSAISRFDRQLAKMPHYLARARSLASTLAAIDGLEVLPNPPQVNMFHLFVDRSSEDLEAARDAVAEDLGLWLFGGVVPADLPQQSRVEIYVGDAAMQLDDDAITTAFDALLSR